MKQEISIEEKIDFIYKRLKKQEKQEKFFLVWKIFLTIIILIPLTSSYFLIMNKINSITNIWENTKNNILKNIENIKNNTEKDKILNNLKNNFTNNQVNY